MLKAEGETDRFRKILERAQKGAEVREMLYLDTMKTVAGQVGRTHIVFPGKDGKPPARLKIYRPSP